MTEAEEQEHFERPVRFFVPRHFYPDLLEASRVVRMDWLFREGAEFICETCRSFTVPAKGLLLMLRKIGERIESEESGYFWSNIIAPQLKTYHVFTEDEWVRYREGTLRRVPFL